MVALAVSIWVYWRVEMCSFWASPCPQVSRLLLESTVGDYLHIFSVILDPSLAALISGSSSKVAGYFVSSFFLYPSIQKLFNWKQNILKISKSLWTFREHIITKAGLRNLPLTVHIERRKDTAKRRVIYIYIASL